MDANIAFGRETVKPPFRVPRQYAFAMRNEPSHCRLMRNVEKRRAALRRFFDSYGPRSRNRVCKKAKVSESAVRAFMKGDTEYLEERTYDRLSGYSGWSVAALKGDEPPPDFTKNHGVVKDSVTPLPENSPRSDSAPESEGGMGERDRLDIVNDVLALPSEHLAGVRRYLDAIKAVTGQTKPHPRTRGKTGS